VQNHLKFVNYKELHPTVKLTVKQLILTSKVRRGHLNCKVFRLTFNLPTRNL
jgi:hypothetical protein